MESVLLHFQAAFNFRFVNWAISIDGRCNVFCRLICSARKSTSYCGFGCILCSQQHSLILLFGCCKLCVIKVALTLSKICSPPRRFVSQFHFHPQSFGIHQNASTIQNLSQSSNHAKSIRMAECRDGKQLNCDVVRLCKVYMKTSCQS